MKMFIALVAGLMLSALVESDSEAGIFGRFLRNGKCSQASDTAECHGGACQAKAACPNPHCRCANCTCGADCKCYCSADTCADGTCGKKVAGLNPACKCVNCTCVPECKCAEGACCSKAACGECHLSGAGVAASKVPWRLRHGVGRRWAILPRFRGHR